MKSASIEDVYEFVTNEINSKENIAIALDPDLKYLSLNQNACKFLMKEEYELIGQCVIDLFPSIIASRNHRNLLKAAAGETIKNDIVEGTSGARFIVTYEPLFIDHQVRVIFILAKQLSP